tara:strand:+ start:26036 stop:26182 length:147 start_codon:yes stop_codon:yes gene_type:complete
MNIGKLFGKIGKALIKVAVPILKEEATDVVMDVLAKREAKKAAKRAGP